MTTVRERLTEPATIPAWLFIALCGLSGFGTGAVIASVWIR